MRQTAPLLIAILLAAGVPGCANHSQSSLAGPSTPAVAPMGQEPDVPVASETPSPQAEVRELPLEVFYDQYMLPGLAPSGPFSCDPNKPWVCEAYYFGIANFTGTFTGSAYVWGHLHVNNTDRTNPNVNRPVWAQEIFSFTGSVEGCGSGSMTILGTGDFSFTQDPDPTAPAFVHARGWLAPGSTSTGLAGLVGFDFTVAQHRNFVAPGHGTGLMWCR